MKKVLITLISAIAGMCVSAVVPFEQELVKSGYVHSTLALDSINSLEAKYAAKPVLAEKKVDMGEGWQNWGIGRMVVDKDSGCVSITYPTSTGKRAVGGEGDRDYAVYGRAALWYDLKGADFEDYNRIAFDIRPVCPGMRVVNMNLGFNNGRHDKAGYNQPTGNHLVNLQNGKWNRCYLEVADFQRDCMSGLYFDVSLNGRDITTCDTATYQIANIRFQKVAKPEKVSGWQPDSDAIIYSMTGYSVDGHKTAIVASGTSHKFEIRNADNGKKVFSGKIKNVETTTGCYGVADFSSLRRPGRYYIKTESRQSRPFAVGDESIWDNSQWRVLNFLFGQRCGHDVPGVHGRCHTDLYAVHNGIRIPFSGGWHDAGDLSQQTLQTADVAYSLLRASEEAEGHNPALAARLREEALWGLDFGLRMRFGDGYRASSMGLLIWQDGKSGTMDDITSVRVQNNSFDNYLHAAYEAYAASTLKDDKALVDYLTKVAKEDFDFAETEFAKTGLGGWISEMEHSYNTSMSQMMATISWSASQLFRLTGDRRYSRRSADAIRYVLACQESVGVGDGNSFKGFFYRDLERKSLVHFIHQSRDQIYMQAIEALCETQPTNPEHDKWMRCARLYGDYIKSIMKYTAPYGMIPSGIYRDDEYLDSYSFEHLHLWAPSNAIELYKTQFGEGASVGEHFAVRRFPIWFSIFNGNIAVHASTGIGAAIAGHLLDDKDLVDIAREQLYWIVGKNPFSQSLIYGEGHDYPMLNNFSSGELTGAMPVGIRSLGNSDEPYFPQINNACYKEVWVTSAGKWLGLLAEINNAKS